MRNRLRFLTAAAFSALLVYGAALPADAAGRFDGTYTGIVKLTRSGGGGARSGAGSGGNACAGNAEGMAWRRQVVNNVIKMQWGNSEYEVTVAADGTLSGSTNVAVSRISASGKITGNNMVLEYGSQTCGYRVEAVRPAR